MMKWDILGLGVTSVDDLLYVDAFPVADAKTRVLRRERQCGGLTGTAMVTAARLGVRVAYGGMLGDDELSAIVERNLRTAGVDTSLAVRRREARPVHSTIVVGSAGNTRNIFFELSGPTGADESGPTEEAIASAAVLFVDHYGVEGNLRAIGMARAAGREVVADLERDDHPRFGELLGAVGHLIVSEKFALKVSGAFSAEEAARRLWGEGRRAVVVTCGERGCWFAGAAREARHWPAYPVEVVDTTGCGDVFHGAYGAALACEMGLEERVRFASASAALKATRPGGQAGIPDRSAVERLMGSR